MSRQLRLFASGLAIVLLAGCGFKGAYSLPLPGGAASGKTITVSAEFADVEDLVPQNAVRVNDVAVGDVTKIQTATDPATGRIVAKVTMKIDKNVHLPYHVVGTLEQTTLLGEKFVALAADPAYAPTGVLQNNAQIAESSTSDLPDVEEVFGALSQVLNGGSLGDLQTINIEITKALAGREEQVRDALKQLDTFVSGLDTQKSQIVRALDELNRFSGGLAQQSSTIGAALDTLPAGLKVLADERAQFTDLLTKLSTFGRVASHVINASRANTITDLRDLQPVLGHLAAAGSNLPHALEILISFPFPKGFTNATPGDYAGLRLSFSADPIFCLILESALGTTSPLLPATCKNASSPLTTTTAPATTHHHKKSKKSGSSAGGSKKTGVLQKLLPTPLPTSTSGLGRLLGGVTGGTG